MMDVAMATRVKGAAILDGVSVVREVCGAARFEQLVLDCPQETQKLLQRTMMAIEWVNLDLWTPFLEVLHRQIALQDEPRFRRLLRAFCQRDFQTVYRPYIQSATAVSLCSKIPQIWSAYFESGSLSAGVLAQHDRQYGVTVQLRDIESASPLVTTLVHAYIEQVLTMVGAKDCQVTRMKELRQQQLRHACEYQIRFRA
jgi:hypothetical protein